MASAKKREHEGPQIDIQTTTCPAMHPLHAAADAVALRTNRSYLHDPGPVSHYKWTYIQVISGHKTQWRRRVMGLYSGPPKERPPGKQQKAHTNNRVESVSCALWNEQHLPQRVGACTARALCPPFGLVHRETTPVSPCQSPTRPPMRRWQHDPCCLWGLQSGEFRGPQKTTEAVHGFNENPNKKTMGIMGSFIQAATPMGPGRRCRERLGRRLEGVGRTVWSGYCRPTKCGWVGWGAGGGGDWGKGGP